MPTNLTRGYLGGVNSGIGCSTLLPLWLAFIVVVWPSIPTIELPPRGCWFWGAFYVSFWEALGIVSGRQTLLPTLSLSPSISHFPHPVSHSLPPVFVGSNLQRFLHNSWGALAGWVYMLARRPLNLLCHFSPTSQPASQPASRPSQHPALYPATSPPSPPPPHLSKEASLPVPHL